MRLSEPEQVAVAWFRRARRLARAQRRSMLEFQFVEGALAKIRIDEKAQISFRPFPEHGRGS